MQNATRGRRVLYIALLIAVPAILGAVGFECYVRLTSEYGHVTPESLRAQSLQYAPAVFARNVFPQQEQRIVADGGGLQFLINPLGYRGRPVTFAKPPGVTRIMVYGGSSAFDSSNPEGKDWPRLLERGLRKAGFPSIEVINAGIPGHASDDSVGRLLTEGHLFDPDYVLLYTGWNDIKDFRATLPLLRLHRPAEREDPRTTYQNAPDRWLSEVSQLYVRLRSRYYTWKYDAGSEGSAPEGEYASTLSPMALRQYRMNVAAFVDIARDAGAVPVLVTQGRLVARENTPVEKERIHYDFVLLTHEALCDAFEEADRILREVADEKHVPLIDASSRISGQDIFFEDHVHLTAAGSAALARVIGESIQPWLSPAPPTPSPAHTWIVPRTHGQ